MKKLITLFLITCISVSLTGIFVAADSGETLIMTLEEAQKRALENNLQYKLQDSSINDALESYYDAEESYDKQSSTAARGFIDYFNKPITLEVSVDTAANKVKSSRLKKENIKRTSDYNVLKVFVAITKAESELENAKLDTAVKLNELEAAKGKYNLGIINASALKQSENSYKASVDKEVTSFNNLQKEVQTLNRYIGRELTDYNIKAVLDLSDIDISSIDLDEIRKNYISSDENLYNLALNADVAKRKYDLTKERYEEFVVRLKVDNSREQMEEAYSDATLEYDNARRNFEEATIDLDMSLLTNYNALKSAAETIEDLISDIKTAKDETAIAAMKYDMGLISKAAKEKAELELKALENKLDTSRADLNLQYADLMMYSE